MRARPRMARDQQHPSDSTFADTESLSSRCAVLVVLCLCTMAVLFKTCQTSSRETCFAAPQGSSTRRSQNYAAHGRSGCR